MKFKSILYLLASLPILFIGLFVECNKPINIIINTIAGFLMYMSSYYNPLNNKRYYMIILQCFSTGYIYNCIRYWSYLFIIEDAYVFIFIPAVIFTFMYLSGLIVEN